MTDKKKKLLVMTSTFPRSGSDKVTARFVLDLALAMKGHCDVKVLAPHSPGAERKGSVEGVPVERFVYFFPVSAQRLAEGPGIMTNIRNNKLLFFEIPFFFMGELIAAYGSIKRNKIEVVNSHWIVPQGLITAILKCFLKFRHVITVHAADVFLLKRMGAFGRAIARFTVARSDVVVAVSGYVKDTLDAIVGRKYNCVVLPMGVDPKRFTKDPEKSEATPEREKLNLLFVGKFVEKKGIKFLLEAMGQINKEGFKAELRLIGGGPLEKEFKDFVARNGLESVVKFDGWTDNAELTKSYAWADVVVVPSVFDASGETEGMPVVVLEAMACARPVLGSDISGIPDIVKDGVNGWLVLPGDAFHLAEKIKKICQEKDLSKYKEQAGITAKSYSYGMIAEKYSKLMDGPVSGNGGER